MPIIEETARIELAAEAAASDCKVPRSQSPIVFSSRTGPRFYLRAIAKLAAKPAFIVLNHAPHRVPRTIEDVAEAARQHGLRLPRQFCTSALPRLTL